MHCFQTTNTLQYLIQNKLKLMLLSWTCRLLSYTQNPITACKRVCIPENKDKLLIKIHYQLIKDESISLQSKNNFNLQQFGSNTDLEFWA